MLRAAHARSPGQWAGRVSMVTGMDAAPMAAPLLVLCVSALWENCVSARLNQRPIIGVLAHESNDVIPFGKSYIPASYVKILESAGARVAPISMKLTEAEYTELLHSINGRTFKKFPKNLLQALQIRPLTGHYHYWGVSMKNFTNNKKLNNFYRILTTNMDNQRVEYVSTVEARWNFNHFSNTTEEEKALIYNYTPMYTGNISRFEQVYLID
ncbi:hypothetical protein chiPu_0015456 [Chiloscyllium punctatum]|uniref:Folate gamma-glutamyl hydrolase n=1 Tax=Chiloscyllium punctatum TaxID=137246 RepID=A0A401T2R9_CHIPU|nr:hypothetical protein [Chiloscyllium punctatum]